MGSSDPSYRSKFSFHPNPADTSSLPIVPDKLYQQGRGKEKGRHPQPICELNPSPRVCEVGPQLDRIAMVLPALCILHTDPLEAQITVTSYNSTLQLCWGVVGLELTIIRCVLITTDTSVTLR